MALLLALLLLFNDPFYAFNMLEQSRLYLLLTTVCQASFMAMLLMFWLIVIDTIGSVDILGNGNCQIYLPKVFLTGLLWVLFVASILYVREKERQDPTFNWTADEAPKLKSLTYVLLALLLVYVAYFLLLTIRAFSHLR